MKRSRGDRHAARKWSSQRVDDVRSERSAFFSRESSSRDGFGGRERNGFYGREQSPSPRRKRKSNRKAKKNDSDSEDKWGFADNKKGHAARAVRNWQSSKSSSEGFYKKRGKNNRNYNRDASADSSDAGFGFGSGHKHGKRDKRAKSVRVSEPDSRGYANRKGKKAENKGKRKADKKEKGGWGDWVSEKEDKWSRYRRERSSSPSGWGKNYGKRSNRRQSRDSWERADEKRERRHSKWRESHSSTSSVGTGTAIRLRNRVAKRYRSGTVLATAGGFDAMKEAAKWNQDGRLRTSSDRRRHEPQRPKRPKKGIFSILSCF